MFGLEYYEAANPGKRKRELVKIDRGVARIMEKYRHKLFWRRSLGRIPRKLMGYTTERVTFLIILLLTT